MFHSIITILTTAAVALHAMLGCCAHHSHDCCETHGLTAAFDQSNGRCHGHDHEDHVHEHKHHQHDDAKSPTDDSKNDCSHQHDGDQPHKCDTGDCSFTTVERTNDLDLSLTFSYVCQTLYDVAHIDAINNLVALNLAAKSPPDILCQPGTVRAASQVWRL